MKCAKLSRLITANVGKITFLWATIPSNLTSEEPQHNLKRAVTKAKAYRRDSKCSARQRTENEMWVVKE